MEKTVRVLLDREKIEYAGILPFSECRVINPGLLERSWRGGEVQSVIMLSVPYRTGDFPSRNLSLYAVPRDYHLYFRQLFSHLEKELAQTFPGYTFKGYADHSPIGETYAASKAGLGVIGDKFQLINEKYGSYTFLGEILTDRVFEAYDTREPTFCSHCGACARACPVGEGCLSEMTQRKGELTPETEELMRKTGTVWGCDICRTCCPMNDGAARTPIAFFYEKPTPYLTSEAVEAMSEEEFLERAYSWRGRKTILRNLFAFEKKDD